MKSLIALLAPTLDLFHSERERDRKWEGVQTRTEVRTKNRPKVFGTGGIE